VITGEERELFERSVQHAASTATGADLDAALADLGWLDALEADRQLAVSVVFEAQGRAGSTSSSLDAVLASALGLDPAGAAVVLPSLGGVALPSVHRAAYLHRRLQQLLDTAPAGALDPARVGEVTQILYAFRARSRATQHRLHHGETLGAETSIDKVLVATAEQAVFDLAEEGLAASVTLGDDPVSQRWRSEFLYSRSATIYGGSAEIQRNIIARRLLDLGSDR